MFLIAKGYRILARRWKTPVGESDIVARRLRTLVFVEVKARARPDDAVEAVTPRGMQRIVAAAELWLAHHPHDAGRNIRFDVMLVTPGRMPQHIANAFDATR
jgi:putative endonuclease